MHGIGSILARVIFWIFLLTCAWFLYSPSTLPAWPVSNLPQNVNMTTSDSKDGGSMRTILMWTTVLGKKGFYGFEGKFDSEKEDGMQTMEDVKNKCDYKCEFTMDRSLVNRSHAILFHAWAVDLRAEKILVDGQNVWKPIDPPPIRDINQFYVYVTREAPIRMTTNMEAYRHFFNWTMTHRLDSDFPITNGEFRKKTLQYNKASFNDSVQGLTKTNLVAWLVSNCWSVPSGRGKLVQELKKYIPVNIYGKCGNKRCNKTLAEDCYAELGKSHKFYLSFENSLCKDYVTEKFFNAFEAGMVPVVYGAANYDLRFPFGSFINIDSFASAKALADYLLYLDKNDEEYLKYFEWRKYYTVTRENHAGELYCKLCKRLHEDYGKASSRLDIVDWTLKSNSTSPVCIQPPKGYW